MYYNTSNCVCKSFAARQTRKKQIPRRQRPPALFWCAHACRRNGNSRAEPALPNLPQRSRSAHHLPDVFPRPYSTARISTPVFRRPYFPVRISPSVGSSQKAPLTGLAPWGQSSPSTNCMPALSLPSFSVPLARTSLLFAGTCKNAIQQTLYRAFGEPEQKRYFVLFFVQTRTVLFINYISQMFFHLKLSLFLPT